MRSSLLAYCRYKECSVYMYKTKDQRILCHGCGYYYDHPLEAFLHLCDHEDEGDFIPEYAFKKLEQEIKSDNWRIDDES